MSHLRRLAGFLRPYWRRSSAALALLITVVLMDLAIPRLIQRIIDDGIRAGNMGVVARTTLLMLAISAAQALFAVGNNILSIQVGERVARDLREAVFRKIQSLSFGDLDRFGTGRLMTRLTSDAAACQRMVQISLRIGTRAPLLMAGSLALMFHTDAALALRILPILAATAAVIVFFAARMGPLFHSVQDTLDGLNTVLQESIAGARLVKAFVRAGREEERFADVNGGYTVNSIRVMRFLSMFWPSMRLLVNLGLVTVVWAGGLRAASAGVTEGQIVAFINYLQTTLGPLAIMALLANAASASAASAERINEVLDAVPEVLDPPAPRDLPEGKARRVALEGVRFRYGGADRKPVLEDIDLAAEPGRMVAVLGATGAGKSSLVRLIPRFYDPSSGRVTLDGMDIREARQEEVRGQAAVVLQDTVLFSGTVRGNIAFGRPEAAQEDIEEAARAAQAHDFILKLPSGYAARVEERGVNLSGGQKQRIAIARALLMRSPILILDDATSSVDLETEGRIHEALRERMGGATLFVVAQRVSSVMRADTIVVIDRGRIEAQGTHARLLESSPVYREIYDSQLGGGPAPGEEP